MGRKVSMCATELMRAGKGDRFMVLSCVFGWRVAHEGYRAAKEGELGGLASGALDHINGRVKADTCNRGAVDAHQLITLDQRSGAARCGTLRQDLVGECVVSMWSHWLARRVRWGSSSKV